MKYYFKFGHKLIIQSFVTAAWVLFICFKTNNTTMVNGFIALGFGYNIIMFLYNGLKPVLLALKRKPLIEVDEVYIFDNMEGVKYKWCDGVEITEDTNALRVKMFWNNTSPVNAAEGPLKYKIVYIKLDNIKGDKVELLMTLDRYSIKAGEMDATPGCIS